MFTWPIEGWTRRASQSYRARVYARELSMRAAAVVLLGVVLAINIYRAATQSVTHDEALTYELFAAEPWSTVFHSYDANHHVLYTILCKIATGILGAGTSAFACRARWPAVFWTVYRICDRLWGPNWGRGTRACRCRPTWFWHRRPGRPVAGPALRPDRVVHSGLTLEQRRAGPVLLWSGITGAGGVEPGAVILPCASGMV